MQLKDLDQIDLNDIKGLNNIPGVLLCGQNFDDRFPNILPIAYVKDSKFQAFSNTDLGISYGAKFKESRDSIDLTFQPLIDRFCENELFYLTKFEENHNPYAEPFFAYGNETKRLDGDVIEIYEGKFDPSEVYFTPSTQELFSLIEEKVSDYEKYSEEDFSMFRNIFSETLQLNSNAEEDTLYSRCRKIFNLADAKYEQVKKFIEILPATKVYQRQLEENETIKRQLVDEINGLQSKVAKLNDETQLKQQDLAESNEKLEDIRLKIDQTTNTQIEEAKENNAELKQLLEENEEIRIELEKISHFQEIKNLKKDVEDLRADRRVLERDKGDLEASINTLSQEFISNQKTANEKLKELVKSKTHYDLINGRDFDRKQTKESLIADKDVLIVSSFFENNLKDSEIVSHERLLVNEISRTLKQFGRNYTPDFIANLLICLFQNTATIFSGSPGSGKTSLARLLTNIITKDISKIVEVPVGKGWTTQKDLVGFYNPLSKEFIPANEKLYYLIKTLEKETIEGLYRDSNLGFVILDEANLSPIEHYWSSFYNLTDSFVSKNNYLSLDLGAGQNIKYANNLRFIGTINTDQTTEELSPRFLDRTNIIRMSSNLDITSNISFPCNDDIPRIEISYNDIIKMFNLKDFSKGRDVLSDFEKESYKPIRDDFRKIKDAFRTLGISINPRIDIGFAEYMVTASKFMSLYKALDYFVAQRLLTKIDGQGQIFGQSLSELKELLTNIFLDKRLESITVKTVNEIIHIGERDEYFNNYNYFLLN